METLDKKITLTVYERYIEELSYFGWKLVHINKDDEYAYMQFQRDTNLKNYQEIKKLEEEWFSFEYPPMWPLIVFTIISFGFLTALLVTWIVTPKESFNLSLCLLTMGLPGIIFSIISFIYMWFRVKKMKDVLDNGPTRRKEIKEKALDLLNEKN